MTPLHRSSNTVVYEASLCTEWPKSCIFAFTLRYKVDVAGQAHSKLCHAVLVVRKGRELTRALEMVDPLHHNSLLYAEYMTVIVEERSGLQYQTVERVGLELAVESWSGLQYQTVVCVSGTCGRAGV